MAKKLPARFYIEAVLGALTFIGFVVTLINHEWIETLFNVDPDQGSGALEWGIIAGLAAVTLAFFSLAGMEWRRYKAATA